MIFTIMQTRVKIVGQSLAGLHFLHAALLCSRHTNPMKQSSIAHFAIVAQDGNSSWRHHRVTYVDLWCHANTRHCNVMFLDCSYMRKFDIHFSISTSISISRYDVYSVFAIYIYYILPFGEHTVLWKARTFLNNTCDVLCVSIRQVTHNKPNWLGLTETTMPKHWFAKMRKIQIAVLMPLEDYSKHHEAYHRDTHTQPTPIQNGIWVIWIWNNITDIYILYGICDHQCHNFGCGWAKLSLTLWYILIVTPLCSLWTCFVIHALTSMLC